MDALRRLQMLSAILLGLFFSPCVLAQETAEKPELTVSTEFWKFESTEHIKNITLTIWPFTPKRRWIGYIDGERSNEFRFYQAAGLEHQVAKQRRHRTINRVLLGAGLTAILAGNVALVPGENIFDEIMPHLTPYSVILIGTGLTTAAFQRGVHKRTRRDAARAVAAQHNADR